MAPTRKSASPAAAAAADAAGDHLRFLRPGALARLRDARFRRRMLVSRWAPPSPSPPPPPSPLPTPAAGDGESGPFVPYFMPVSRLLAPRCPRRKKLTAAKAMMLFSSPQPSPDLPLEAVMEFLNPPDMVVAAH